MLIYPLLRKIYAKNDLYIFVHSDLDLKESLFRRSLIDAFLWLSVRQIFRILKQQLSKVHVEQ